MQEALIDLLRPAIALSATRADDAEIPIGASKFGGAPDVPDGFEWPMWNEKPLGFLAQINLGEVAGFDVEELLPKSGLLSFFYDFDSMPWGFIKDRGAWHVIHFAGQELTRFGKISLHVGNNGIAFETRCEVPNGYALNLSHIEIEDEEEADYQKLCSLLDPYGHKLLGYAFGVQYDEMQESCQLRACRCRGVICQTGFHAKTS